MRPRGALGSEVQTAYLTEIICPQIAYISIIVNKLSSPEQDEIIKKHNINSLRKLAKEYQVSYETIRRTIKRQRDF